MIEAALTGLISHLSLTGPEPLYGPVADIAVDAGAVRWRQKLCARHPHRHVNAGDPDLPEYVAEPGDSASLVIERSLLAWPAPFEINVVGLGGTATKWQRHVYYRLSWIKAPGARLSLSWAGEQPYDGVNLWRAPGSFLVKVDIH